MAVADRSGLPVAICIASASPHETRLVQSVLDHRFLAALPERLIGDKAYDSDPLDACLAEQGVVLIAPHRSNRKRAPTQGGRVLRRTIAVGRWSGCLRGCSSFGSSIYEIRFSATA